MAETSELLQAGVLDEAEEDRLRALGDLDLLDTLESESFDRITRMASLVFRTPIAAVSLTDRNRQWFKSHIGTAGREIPRFQAPCAEVTRSKRNLLVPDLCEDVRFSTSILARSGIRFYAGAPLTTRHGHTLGAMCVLDEKPRIVSDEEMKLLNDMAAMVISQIELQHDLGRIDPLSGLPNRNQILEDLEDLERANAGEDRVAVLIDLADPKLINEIVSVLGTVCFDEMIKASRQIVENTLGRKGGLYQVNAGSFLLTLNGTESDQWMDVIAPLSKRFKTPIACSGIPVVIQAAFGVSPFRVGACSPRDVLRTAVSAVQDARRAEVEYAVYSQDSDQANWRRFTILSDFRDALKCHGKLKLAYQPRIEVSSGRCVGAEALLRWKHDRLGSISPGEFIPLIEQTALTRPTTEWVLNEALQQIAEWRKKDRAVRVSINVSALNLQEHDFAARLNRQLEKWGVSPSSLELEFTESALIRNGTRVQTQLGEMREMGIELSIDDFGTGYSTLSYLQTIPAQTVKLDQSFMRTLFDSSRNQMLVRSMVTMAHDLGYRVVAEGVETSEMLAFLNDCKCEEAQGFLIARPLFSEAFESWLSRNSLDAGVGGDQFRRGIADVGEGFAHNGENGCVAGKIPVMAPLR